MKLTLKQMTLLGIATCLMLSCSNPLDKGIGIYNKQDFVKAEKYFRKAAEKGNNQAIAWLGLCSESRENTYDSAKALYKKAIENGEIQWFLDKAEENIPQIQAQLGYCYMNGIGVDKNQEKAFYWNQVGANNNNARAQYNLSICYHLGVGVEPDDTKALEWIKKAAEQGNIVAERELGLIYWGKLDFGIPIDTNEAAYWLAKAANKGNALSQSYLGMLCLQEKQMEKNAFKWLKLASDAGEKSAYNNLGYCYATGTGTRQNIKASLHWYKLSANNGEIAEMQNAMQNYAANAYAIYSSLSDEQKADAKHYLMQSIKSGSKLAVELSEYIEKIDSRLYNGTVSEYDPNNISTYSLPDNRYLATLEEYIEYLKVTGKCAQFNYSPDSRYCWITAYERDKYEDIFHLANPYGANLAVDLGLSVKWASKNIGANMYYDLGDRFAWGETAPKKDYNWLTYKYAKGSSETFIPIGSDIKGTKYDAATVNWGKHWRMPTIYDYNELIENCAFEWVKSDNYQGMKVTGPNGNSIFFPCKTGFFGEDYYTSQDNCNQSIVDSDVSVFKISNSSYEISIYANRCNGNYIRAVFVK